MLSKRILILSLGLFVGLSALASDKGNLEATVNQQYRNRTYTFRHPIRLNLQRYDSSAKPLILAEGAWTLYGRILIHKISLKNTKILVEGERIGLRYNAIKKKLVPTNLHQNLTIELQLDQPASSDEQVRVLLGKLFAFTRDEFIASVPALWRPYLSAAISDYSDDGVNLDFKPLEEALMDLGRQMPPVPGIERAGTDGIKPPVAKETPSPDYPAAASSYELKGSSVFSVTINESGGLQDVFVVRPLGLGLDDEMGSTLRDRWRFEPVLKNGQPIKASTTIELVFH